jgi:chromosome segregation ATPase
MDKDLRRQLEDMEEAVERGRVERRRLNAEIDKLESELADAKAEVARMRATSGQGSKGAGIDPAALLKIQEAADEKLKKARSGWETERSQMKSQINRLEGAVAEAIARASNPMRATQSVKSASALLEAERTRLVAAQAGGRNGVDTAAITGEVSRVERQLSEVIAVIDNPNTELATVIRKNVEKAEPDAYLKGSCLPWERNSHKRHKGSFGAFCGYSLIQSRKHGD